MLTTAPIPASYWLLERQLLAGEYPGANDEARARARLELILRAGIVSFIDLTEPIEPLRPYTDLLTEFERELRVQCRYARLSFRDGGVPTGELMTEILATIRAELDERRPVYIHCWGGIGRTGTVAGCWLIEQGRSPEEALEHISLLRRGTPDAAWPSPQNEEQRQFVRAWARRR